MRALITVSLIVFLALLLMNKSVALSNIELISVSSSGEQGNGPSRDSSISRNGRYVAFSSHADNLILGDTNLKQDIFMRDRATGETSRVSIASDGSQANNACNHPSVSGDGRYVAFWSHATNLVPGDTNNRSDIFVHDRTTGLTTRVSIAVDGTQANQNSEFPSISGDGRYIAFWSHATNLVPGDANTSPDVFIHNRATGGLIRASIASGGTEGNNSSEYPSLSDDGRHVTFTSYANNLVPGDTNGERDVFVHDSETGGTTRVNIASNGTQANIGSLLASISGDGNYVAFGSAATTLVAEGKQGAYLHDRTTGQTVGVPSSRRSFTDVSAAGRYIASSNSSDSSGVAVYDRITGQAAEIGEGSYPSISSDGLFVAFEISIDRLVPEDSNGFVDIFVAEVQPFFDPIPEPSLACPKCDINDDGVVNILDIMEVSKHWQE